MTNRDPAFSAIRQDIEAVKEAFSKDDFDNMNIFSNRIMSNAFLAGNRKLALPGFFMKEVALQFGNLKRARKPTALSTAKAQGESFLKQLDALTMKPDFDEQQLWQYFKEYYNNIRKFLMNDMEQKVYAENPEFVSLTTRHLLEYLRDNKEVLTDRENLFLRGLINELSRIQRVHGADFWDLYAYSLITALERLYDYILRLSLKVDGSLDDSKIRKTIFGFADKIIELLLSQEKEKVTVSAVDELLFELIYQWRMYFIYYMEKMPILERKGIELSEETREALGVSIAKGLEKKVRRK